MLKNCYPTLEASVLTYAELEDQEEFENSLLKHRFKYTTGRMRFPHKLKSEDETEAAMARIFSQRTLTIKRLLTIPKNLHETLAEIQSIASAAAPKLSAPKPLSEITLTQVRAFRSAIVKTGTPLPGMNAPFKAKTLTQSGPDDATHTLLDMVASLGTLIGLYPLKLATDLDLVNLEITNDLLNVFDWESSFDFAVLESLSELAHFTPGYMKDENISADGAIEVSRFIKAWELMIQDHMMKNFSNFEAAAKKSGVPINSVTKLNMVSKNLNQFSHLLTSSQKAHCGADRKYPGNFIITTNGKTTSRCPEQIIQDAVNQFSTLSEKDRKKIADQAWDWLFVENGSNKNGSRKIISRALAEIALFYKDPQAAMKANPRIMLFNNTNTSETVEILDKNIVLQEQILVGVVESILLEEHLIQNNEPKVQDDENAWNEFLQDPSEMGIIKKQLASKIWKRLNFSKIASGKFFTEKAASQRASQITELYGDQPFAILQNLAKWRIFNSLANPTPLTVDESSCLVQTLSGRIPVSQWICHNKEFREHATEIIISQREPLRLPSTLPDSESKKFQTYLRKCYSQHIPHSDSNNICSSWLEHREQYLCASTPLKESVTYQISEGTGLEIFDLTPQKTLTITLGQEKEPVPPPKPVDDSLHNLSEKEVWDKVYEFSEKMVMFIATLFKDTVLNNNALGIWKPSSRAAFTTKHVRKVFNVSMDNDDLTRKFRQLDPSWLPPQGCKNARHLAFRLVMALMANGAGEEMATRGTNAKLLNPVKWVDYLVKQPAEIIR